MFPPFVIQKNLNFSAQRPRLQLTRPEQRITKPEKRSHRNEARNPRNEVQDISLSHHRWCLHLGCLNLRNSFLLHLCITIAVMREQLLCTDAILRQCDGQSCRRRLFESYSRQYISGDQLFFQSCKIGLNINVSWSESPIGDLCQKAFQTWRLADAGACFSTVA